MSGLFRSEPMTYVRLVMVEEVAPEVIRTLARDFGKFHVIDMGQPEDANNKRYKLRLVACQTWEKKLEAFREIMKQQGITPPSKAVDPVPSSIPSGDVVELVQAYLDPIEEDLGIHINFHKQQTQLINELREQVEVLHMCRKLHHGEGDDLPLTSAYGTFADQKAPNEEPLLVIETGSEFKESLSGAVSAIKAGLFERMIFRVSRGNAIVTFRDMREPIVDPATGELVRKVVFSVLSVRSEQMKRRIKKICSFFGANLYDLPANKEGFGKAIQDAEKKIEDQTIVLGRTRQRISNILGQMAGDGRESPLVNWVDALRKEALVIEVLRKTTMLTSGNGASSTQQQVLHAMGWVPTKYYYDLENAIERMNRDKFLAQQAILSQEEVHRSPPTYFETNKFTSGFQAIVDTYGMPRYQEVNPGLFTIVTFPFLFGVMYGDMLHASCLLAFALYMLINEKKFLYQKKIGQLGEIFGMAFGGRYIVLLMALFGMYAGTLYNDCASISIDVFGTRWDKSMNLTRMTPGVDHYPWGVDPEWYGKKNELIFLNSLKMKLAIVLGVSQMLFGICLGAVNNIHFHDYAGVIFEFLPRIIFMLCTFGYMAFLIIFKWCTDWTTASIDAPNLIQTMIGMFLRPTSLKESDKLYDGQMEAQLAMLIAALLMVPAMLFGKPIISNMEFKRKYGNVRDRVVNEERKHPQVTEVVEEDSGHGAVGPNYNFGDHMITQAIHTIEFVLGSVSNTASYLRLWALSLAHGQLSAVFWSKMIMDYGITIHPVFAFIGFGAWAGATTAVLLCMDVLECFLHALRLHWVEFQNKFFFADGYAFDPFSFSRMDEES